MLRLVPWIGKRSLRSPRGHRKCTDRAVKRGPKKALEASKKLLKGPRDPDHGPRQLRGAPSSLFGALGLRGPAPRKAQESLRWPKMELKTAPQRPKIGSKRSSERWAERVRTKMQRSASRLDGSIFFDGRTAPKRAPNRPGLAPKSAQKASRSEDSTRTVEQSVSRSEVRPRTADPGRPGEPGQRP